MAQKRTKTRFPGVYVRITTDPKRKHNGRPDRAYDYCFKDLEGKLRWETAGWLSEGITEQYASNLRAERIEAVKNPPLAVCDTRPLAQDPQGQPQEKHDEPQSPLFSSLADNYLTWLEGESKYADRERFRYDTHIKESLGNQHADKITITEANAFKHEILPKMAIGSAKKCLNLCRAIFFHASISGVYSALNPFSRQSGFKMPQGATECERYLLPDEAKMLLDELAVRSPQLRERPE